MHRQLEVHLYYVRHTISPSALQMVISKCNWTIIVRYSSQMSQYHPCRCWRTIDHNQERSH